MGTITIAFVWVLVTVSLHYSEGFVNDKNEFPVCREGELCNQWTRCLSPFICDLSYAALGALRVGRCRHPTATEGGPCGIQGQTCTSSSVCESGYCRSRLPVGSICAGDIRKSNCLSPLQCRGPLVARRCEKPLSLGHRCDGEYQYCAENLQCVKYGETSRCAQIVDIGGKCGDVMQVCRGSSRCITENGSSKCRAALSKGQTCNPPNAICGAGLVCASGKCKSLVTMYASCADEFTLCADGLECKGAGGARHCVRSTTSCSAIKPEATKLPMANQSAAPSPPPLPTRGELCGASSCAPGHICLGNGPFARCYFVQQAYGFCTGEHVVCEDGWDCRGPPTSKICVQSVGLGKGCDNAYFFCAPELECIPWGSQNRCAKFLPSGTACGTPFELCDSGYKCKDSTNGKKCLIDKPTLPDNKLPGANSKCMEPQRWCKSKHVCVGPDSDTKCLGALQEGQSCEVPDRVCVSGTACRGQNGSRRCRRAMIRGKGCDQREYVCEKNLTCMLWGSAMRCVAFRQKGQDCSGSHALCGPGLSCTSDGSGNRKCK